MNNTILRFARNLILSTAFLVMAISVPLARGSPVPNQNAPQVEGQQPPPAPKPAMINSLMDTDIATCKDRGGIVGRNHSGQAVCLKAKKPPTQPQQQPTSQAPAPTEAAPSGPAENPGAAEPEPEANPGPAAPEAPAAGGSGMGGLEIALIAGAVGVTALGVAAAASAASKSSYGSGSSGGSGGLCSTNYCLPSVFQGNPCECAVSQFYCSQTSGAGGYCGNGGYGCASGYYCNNQTCTAGSGC
jgi:hypothetical protein